MRTVRFRRAAVAAAMLAALATVLAVAAPAEQTVEVTGGQAASAPAREPRQQGHVPPPKQLKKVGDHWTPYDPPPVPEGAEVHVIAAGDTLWDLAQKKYGDPYLWPTIWDANRYVTYSHWIYPGDPLNIPPRPNVVTDAGPEGLPEAVEDLEAEPDVVEAGEPAAPAGPAAPPGPALYPAADGQELACSAQLLEQFDPGPLRIAGREVQRELQAEGDILYLSAGRDMQIKPGAEFVITRAGGSVNHPVTHKPHAVYVRRLGRVRVLAVQATSAIAEVTVSCDAINEGDHLVPYRATPVPMIERLPLARVATAYPGRRLGAVVVGPDIDANLGGHGDIVGVDLSSRAGITVGDRVLFWRPGPGAAPRSVFAQGVVLSTNGGGSMVKIIEATNEVQPGDRIEVL